MFRPAVSFFQTQAQHLCALGAAVSFFQTQAQHLSALGAAVSFFQTPAQHLSALGAAVSFFQAQAQHLCALWTAARAEAPVAVVCVHEPRAAGAPTFVRDRRAGLLGAGLEAVGPAGAGVASLREDGALLAGPPHGPGGAGQGGHQRGGAAGGAGRQAELEGARSLAAHTAASVAAVGSLPPGPLRALGLSCLHHLVPGAAQALGAGAAAVDAVTPVAAVPQPPGALATLFFSGEHARGHGEEADEGELVHDGGGLSQLEL